MRFNLILGIMWAAMGAVLLVVNITGKTIDGLPPGRDSMLVGGLAMVLAAYNFLRWWVARSRKPAAVAPPPKKKPVDGKQLEYLPEFDFTRSEPKSITLPEDNQPR